jgi:hypothetical protein
MGICIIFKLEYRLIKLFIQHDKILNENQVLIIGIFFYFFRESCGASQPCDTALGLSCSSYPGTGCSCPTTYGANTCDCPSYQYWDGNNCVNRSSNSQLCSNSYECIQSVG